MTDATTPMARHVANLDPVGCSSVIPIARTETLPTMK
jgi:hypothetical protein